MAVSIRAEAVVQEGRARGWERASQRGVHLLRPQRVAAPVLRRQRPDDCESTLALTLPSSVRGD